MTKPMFRTKKNIHKIWEDIAKNYTGTYTISRIFEKEEPVYHDDYLDPYKYTYIPYYEIENTKTGERVTLSKALFITLFEVIEEV